VRLLALVGLLCALVACSSPTTPSSSADAVPVPVPDPVDRTALPAGIYIPRLDTRSTLIATGFDTAGGLEAPPVDQPKQASWWKGSPRPGDPGPAVILGHVDGTCPDGQSGCPGVFYRLDELEVDDEVLVDRHDGSTVRFAVYRVEQVAKDRFPADRVYGDTDGPELRLITCGGVFDYGASHYTDNVIVFARLVDTEEQSR